MDDKVREMLEKLRETAGLAADAAGSAAKQVSQKTGETLEMAKLNMKVFDLNTEIGLALREVGRIVYATHRGEATDETALEAQLALLDGKHAEADAMRSRLGEFKKSVVCPNCGDSCAKGDTFCKKCGQRL